MSTIHSVSPVMATQRKTKRSPHPGRLSDEDAVQFYRILWSLFAYGAARLGMSAPTVPEEFGTLPPDDMLPVRDAVFGAPGLVAEFVASNPFGLDDDDLAI